MKKWLKIIAGSITSLLIFGSISCKKEIPWEWCSDCTVEDISGSYTGTANHIKYTDTVHFTEVNNKEAYLEITQQGDNIQVSTGVVNLFSLTVSGAFSNQYYIEIPGFRSRISAKIWRRENELKVVGTAKKFDSANQLTELLDFEVTKDPADRIKR